MLKKIKTIIEKTSIYKMYQKRKIKDLEKVAKTPNNFFSEIIVYLTTPTTLILILVFSSGFIFSFIKQVAFIISNFN